MNSTPSASASKMNQIAIAFWALAVTLWYFYQFSPAFAPLLRETLHRLWH
jgi:hypothetical protein